jgi:hypothetical protein
MQRSLTSWLLLNLPSPINWKGGFRETTQAFSFAKGVVL